MTIGWEVCVNSSYGSGIIVSLNGGQRSEKFKNTDDDWFIAQEMRLVDRWADFELKTPGLGDLVIVKRSWNDDDVWINVAQFPKGTWEFARLID